MIQPPYGYLQSVAPSNVLASMVDPGNPFLGACCQKAESSRYECGGEDMWSRFCVRI